MRMFLPFFLLFSMFTVTMVYFKPARKFMKAHWLKLTVTVLSVAAFLFVLFAAMSASTWRLF